MQGKVCSKASETHEHFYFVKVVSDSNRVILKCTESNFVQAEKKVRSVANKSQSTLQSMLSSRASRPCWCCFHLDFIEVYLRSALVHRMQLVHLDCAKREASGLPRDLQVLIDVFVPSLVAPQTNAAAGIICSKQHSEDGD